MYKLIAVMLLILSFPALSDEDDDNDNSNNVQNGAYGQAYPAQGNPYGNGSNLGNGQQVPPGYGSNYPTYKTPPPANRYGKLGRQRGQGARPHHRVNGMKPNKSGRGGGDD
ncbi:hypothetical protein [Methylovulum psychrotolerans]|uniref:Translation initiation factor IF-2 n=1 Tax=Methylovulum psychrotolerans TaxID=1704499 RepID=A0A1Z4BYI4_9GAMM|nr:hypothetical protein [Methylovulum psychrotolerans]ASF46367.1 hypothetical protein CEK71_09925 [Methylovulum psychrotolerans]